jgi:hypothetical protein
MRFKASLMLFDAKSPKRIPAPESPPLSRAERLLMQATDAQRPPTQEAVELFLLAFGMFDIVDGDACRRAAQAAVKAAARARSPGAAADAESSSASAPPALAPLTPPSDNSGSLA